MSAENMETTGQLIVLALVVIGLFAILFVLLREFYCWYFKINRHLKNQAALEAKLDLLIEELRKTNSLLESKDA